MTVRLSPHKVSKILRDYLGGIPQIKIAKLAAVDQSSISHYASRFKERAAEVGILAAGKEFGMFNEVDALRSLSVELHKAGLTTAEAKQGFNIVKAFLKMGIGPEQHADLVDVCKEVNDPGFVQAAIKLEQIESQTGMGFHEIISKLEQAINQLPKLEKKLEEVKGELQSVHSKLFQKKQELANQEENLRQYKKEVEMKVAQLEQELSAKMKQFHVEEEELKGVAKLKTELSKHGLDVITLMKLGEEFSHGSTKS